jgi:hypothetical protein
MITQKRLKEVLDYCPNTGFFFWKKTIQNGTRVVGDRAGHYAQSGYEKIRVDGNSYQSHKLAWLYMYGYMPYSMDHIKHNRADNRIKMLRPAGHDENNKNASMRFDNTSGVTGVFWKKTISKWSAQIGGGANRVCLGDWDDINGAIITRKAAEHAYGYHQNHGKAIDKADKGE